MPQFEISLDRFQGFQWRIIKMIASVFFKKLKKPEFYGFRALDWCIGMREWIKNILEKIGIAGHKEKNEETKSDKS